MHAVKTFEVREGSTPSLNYRIEVLYASAVVETFERPTMRAAINAFLYAGYEYQLEPHALAEMSL